MIWVCCGAMGMFLSVALGAFAAHGLKAHLNNDMLIIFETGVRYQTYHSLGLLILGWLSEKAVSPWMTTAGIGFCVGIVLFSGSLYILSLSGVKAWGAVTPVGGLAFLVGWAALAVAAFKLR